MDFFDPHPSKILLLFIFLEMMHLITPLLKNNPLEIPKPLQRMKRC
jgi:hypothetical protein